MQEFEIELQSGTDEYEIDMEDKVVEVYPELEELNVTPSNEDQVFGGEYGSGYSKVTVEGITGETEITENGTYDVTRFQFAKVNLDLSNFATKDEIPTKVSQLENDKNYVTSTELDNKGYLTSIPSTYKTKAENDQLYQPKGNYLTEHQDLSLYAKKDELHSHSNKSILDTITQETINKWNAGGDVDLSAYAKNEDLPTKTSELTNDSGYITNTVANNFNVGSSIYLNKIGSSVNDSAASRLIFGSASKIYSWLASNTSGAFAFSKGDGNITIYPNTGTYNCIMSDCSSDLGRTDKPWKNLYLNGIISNGTTSIAVSKLANKDNYYTKTEIDTKIDDKFNSIVNGNEVSY